MTTHRPTTRRFHVLARLALAALVLACPFALARAWAQNSPARARADAGRAPVASARDAGATVAAPGCTLYAAPAPTRALSPELLRLAPQYFHPTHRGPFLDLIAGTSRYAYYDPADPFARVVPPAVLARADAVTEHFLVGSAVAPPDQTLVVNRATGASVTLRGGARLHVDQALEVPGGVLWILGETVGPDGRAAALTLFRGDNTVPPQTLSQGTPRSPWVAALGVTRTGQLAAAWVEGSPRGGRLSLRVAWVDAAGHAQPARDVDAVTLPNAVADLSLRTGANVVLAQEGDELAVAWRPLDVPAHGPANTGSASQPPMDPFAAHVRLVRLAPAGPQLVAQHPTTVQPLGGTTGIGPWSLDPGGAWALSLDGHAVFLWIDPSPTRASAGLVGARLSDAHPTVLVPGASDVLVAVRSVTGPRAVVHMYRSSPEFRALEVGCRAAGP